MTNRQRQWLLLIGAGLLLLAALIYGLARPGQRRFDWRKSYEQKQKEPFGAYLLHERLPDLLPGARLTEISVPAFDRLAYAFPQSVAYFFCNQDLPADDADTRELLRFASAGNVVFIAAHSLSYDLEEELGVTTENQPSEADSVELLLGKEEKLRFPARYASTRFVLEEEGEAEVLGQGPEGKPVFLRIACGKGAFYLCAQPELFTNYFLLEPAGRAYLEQAFSRLAPSRELWWDEYYKVANLRRRRPADEAGSPSLIAFMMANPSLRWALMSAIAGLLLYALFQSKRMQRPVPLIRPLANTTLEFTRTIGRLYFQHGNHKNLAEKKIRFLTEHIRARYLFRSVQFGPEIVAPLAGKSGLPEAQVADLVSTVAKLRRQSVVSENELIELEHKTWNFIQNHPQSP
jgi:hypothetical protein